MIKKHDSTRCALCRKDRGDHKSKTLNCPVGLRTRVGYTQFSYDQFYTPRHVYAPEASPKKEEKQPVELARLSKEDLAEVMAFSDLDLQHYATRTVEFKNMLIEEMDANAFLREQFGAKEGEGFADFVARLYTEREEARHSLDALKTKIIDLAEHGSGLNTLALIIKACEESQS